MLDSLPNVEMILFSWSIPIFLIISNHGSFNGLKSFGGWMKSNEDLYSHWLKSITEYALIFFFNANLINIYSRYGKDKWFFLS